MHKQYRQICIRYSGKQQVVVHLLHDALVSSMPLKQNPYFTITNNDVCRALEGFRMG